MRKRVLFVDDEQQVLQGLQRSLRNYAREWDMAFVDTGHKAVELLKLQPTDVIVCDLRMPVMDGEQLLREVQSTYPDTVRVALTGTSDRETVQRLKALTHAYVIKPADADMLMAVINTRVVLAAHARSKEPSRNSEASPALEGKIAVDINNIINRAISLTQNEWVDVVDVKTRFDQTMPFVPCLQGKIISLFVNMIVNAAHAVAAVEAGARKPVVEVTTQRDGEWSTVRISDPVTSIPTAMLAKLRSNASPQDFIEAGLPWLALAYSTVVAQHGGGLTVESDGKAGTNVIIRLPNVTHPA